MRRPRGKISRAPVPASGWPAESIGSRGVLPDGWDLVLAEIAAAPGALRPSRLSWLAQPGAPVTRRKGACRDRAGRLRRRLLAGHSHGVCADLSRTCHRPPADLACTWRPGLDAGGRSNFLVTCAFPPRVADVTCDGPQGGSSGVIRQARSLAPAERRAGITSGITQTAGALAPIFTKRIDPQSGQS